MGYFAGLAIGLAMGIFMSFSNVDPTELSKFNNSCASNHGFDKATIQLSKTTVSCKDGAEFRLNK